MSEIKKVDTRLSYSSATLLKNCSQKYYYHKVSGVAKDPDSEDNMDAFNVGKTFHAVLENNNHTSDRLEDLLEEAVEIYDTKEFKGMIHAMLLRYLQVHKKSGLEVVKCEMLLDSPMFLGFVDVILKNPVNGEWWIADLKTAARLSEVTLAKLRSDVQLNLYSYFYKTMGSALGLDPDKFMGARYRVTTKSKLTKKINEGYKEFVIRTAKNVKSYDVVVRKEDMAIEDTFKEHKKLHTKTMRLRSGKEKPVRNLSYCDSFFRPCEFFSHCHGKTFTESRKAVEMVTSDNV